MAVEKKRGLLLTGWLILMLVANISSALSYVWLIMLTFVNPSFFVELMPEMPFWVLYFFGLLVILNIVLVVALLKWKKAGFYGFCGVAAIALIVNATVLNAGVFSIIGLFGPVILYLVMRPKWNLFE